MCWAVSLSLLPSTFKGDKMKKDDRGDLDLTKQIEIKDKEIKTLNDVVVNLKNIIDSKEAEMTALVNSNDSHRELNGDLRKEIDELKSDNKKLAKQIQDLEIEAKEMLAYP
jgi:chromosome segregation ATPase